MILKIVQSCSIRNICAGVNETAQRTVRSYFMTGEKKMIERLKDTAINKNERNKSKSVHDKSNRRKRTWGWQNIPGGNRQIGFTFQHEIENDNNPNSQNSNQHQAWNFERNKQMFRQRLQSVYVKSVLISFCDVRAVRTTIAIRRYRQQLSQLYIPNRDRTGNEQDHKKRGNGNHTELFWKHDQRFRCWLHTLRSCATSGRNSLNVRWNRYGVMTVFVCFDKPILSCFSFYIKNLWTISFFIQDKGSRISCRITLKKPKFLL